jgi:hypothetical protein
MKYKDQGKKMKMAGGGVAEDVKPVAKAFGGTLKEGIIRNIDPLNISGIGEGKRFDIENALKSFDVFDLTGDLAKAKKEREKKEKEEEENIS